MEAGREQVCLAVGMSVRRFAHPHASYRSKHSSFPARPTFLSPIRWREIVFVFVFLCVYSTTVVSPTGLPAGGLLFVGLLFIALFPFVFHVLFLDVMLVIPCACIFLSIPVACRLCVCIKLYHFRSSLGSVPCGNRLAADKLMAMYSA